MKKTLLYCMVASAAGFAQKGLKDVYKKDFKVGVALSGRHINGQIPQSEALILREFNQITPENDMKSERIHPEWNRYDFSTPDKFVDFGKKNNMFVVGHTLVWHSQLSKFAQKINNADSLRLFMKEHISTVVSRYKGRINGWDVVNEALEEDGTMRKSVFYKVLGDQYILDAFKLANAADPNAELYYNDYNIEQPAKRKGAIELIKKIQAAGIRIDGVGIQGHWSINGLPFENIEASIKEFGALGIKVHFTELDITALPNPWDLKGADVNQRFENNARMNPFPTELPDSMQTKLAGEYQKFFSLISQYKKTVDRVTFWGVNDGVSWLNDWPIRGRTNYPLLWDRELRPKPAYHAVIQTKKKNKAKIVL